MNESESSKGVDSKVESTTFRTKDLNQAAFIWCQEGVDLLKLDANTNRGGTVIHFVFTLMMCEEDVGVLLIEYANGKTQVEPTAYSVNQNKLRDLLHGILGKRRGYKRA